MTGKILQADPAAQTCELLTEPALPRVLVIGDSISMNYHEAAKAALGRLVADGLLAAIQKWKTR